MYELRGRGVPVGTQEVLALAQALDAGLHESSLDGFYNVARSVMIHSEAHLDSFDEAFLSFFKGIEVESKKLKDELWEWLVHFAHYAGWPASANVWGDLRELIDARRSSGA